VLTLAGITLDGVAVQLAGVAADVTIRHGRTGYFDGASSSTCQITLLDVDRATVSALELGSRLVVSYQVDGAGAIAPRFTGRVTDGTADGADLTIVAVGRLSELSGYFVANGPYPRQTWSTRIALAFANAQTGNSYGLFELDLRTPQTDPLLVAETIVVDDEPFLDQYLGELVGFMGAAVADLPDGRILIQPASSRSTANAVNLPPAQVLFTPAWRQVLPGANWVRIDAAVQQDFQSQNRFGRRPVEYDTKIDAAADPNSAYVLAGEMRERQAWPVWVIESATLLEGRELAIGQPVRLSGFPSSAPHRSWIAIVEGWTDQLTSDGDELAWTMELALSDPILSGIGLEPVTWAEVPLELTWATINQSTTWAEATTLDSLYP
jgi:hypothetical protein